MTAKLPDVGDWGNGPEDIFTPDDKMRRFYFSFNHEGQTFYGTGRTPPWWSKGRIAAHGMFSNTIDLTISFDVLALRGIAD